MRFLLWFRRSLIVHRPRSRSERVIHEDSLLDVERALDAQSDSLREKLCEVKQAPASTADVDQHDVDCGSAEKPTSTDKDA